LDQFKALAAEREDALNSLPLPVRTRRKGQAGVLISGTDSPAQKAEDRQQ
jgi:hypothetical protein